MINKSNINSTGLDRRSFLARASLMGVASLLPFTALLRASGEESNRMRRSSLNPDDRNIIVAAEIAEALAVTTYMNIINNSPFYTRLPAADQSYLTAALQEEMSHYLIEESVTGMKTPYTKFYYPPNMFLDPQTTLNILVTLEDAFIAAYLVGVRNFTTADLRVTAARIMGIESDHRSLARVIGADIDPQDGGPLTTITGAQGVPESITPANNNGYERTLEWTNISQAVAALTPFVDIKAAHKARFDTSVSFDFEPFTPTLPTGMGDFISFGG